MSINKMEINGIEIVSINNEDNWFVNSPSDCKKTHIWGGERLKSITKKLQSF